MSGLAAKFFALVNSACCPPCTTPTPPAQDVDPHVWDKDPDVAKFNRPHRCLDRHCQWNLTKFDTAQSEAPAADPSAGYFA
jgi:hypothetical protein